MVILAGFSAFFISKFLQYEKKTGKVSIFEHVERIRELFVSKLIYVNSKIDWYASKISACSKYLSFNETWPFSMVHTHISAELTLKYAYWIAYNEYWNSLSLFRNRLNWNALHSNCCHIWWESRNISIYHSIPCNVCGLQCQINKLCCWIE